MASINFSSGTVIPSTWLNDVDGLVWDVFSGASTAVAAAAALGLGTTDDVTFNSLTLSDTLTYGGVTLAAAVTGTGNMVLSASPTFTGTIAGAAQTLTGNLGVGRSAQATVSGYSVIGLGVSGTIISNSSATYDDGPYILSNAYYDGAWKYLNNGEAGRLSFGSDGSIQMHTAGTNASGAGAAITWSQKLNLSNGGTLGINTITVMSGTTATLYNTTATAVNAFGAATTIAMGADGTTSTFKGLMVLNKVAGPKFALHESSNERAYLQYTAAGGLVMDSDGRVDINANNTLVARFATDLSTTLSGTLAVNGASLNSTTATFALLATPTTLTIGAAATTLGIGNSGGTNTILGATTFSQGVTCSSTFTAPNATPTFDTLTVTTGGCTIQATSGYFQVNSGGAIISPTITTAAPSGSTAGQWRLGAADTVSPTSPNRTIAVTVDGTVYYLHAKTTND